MIFFWPAACAFLVSSSIKRRPQRRETRRAMVEEDLSRVPRDELEEMVRVLRAEKAALLRMQRPSESSAFDLEAAAVSAGFAFESYNAPVGARWERGAEGCDVAFASPSFVRECYAGAVVVRVLEARGLRDETELREVALTGAKSDPYVKLAIIEPPRKSTIQARAGNATDVARSTTIWRKGGGDTVRWPANESYCLFVREPANARLAVTVLDEEVAGDDQILGAGEVALSTASSRRTTVALKADADSKMLDPGAGLAGAAVATLAGAATGGAAILGLAAAAAAAAANEKRGFLDLDISYHPFNSDEDVLALAPSLADASSGERGPAGATPGVDWFDICKDVNSTRAADYKALCFLDNRVTGTQAGVWRDEKRKSVLVAFRGTSEPRDLVTDASAATTAWAGGSGDSVPPALGDPRVHAGFRSALDSVARRLKQLLIVAADDDIANYRLELTGHSLGGALATLFALDVAGGVDPEASLPVRPPKSGWFPLFDQPVKRKGAWRKPKHLQLVTFGAPRSGDLAFVEALDLRVPSHFRVVNGQDIVARLPRGFSYAHAGATILVSDDPDDDPLWVEGTDDGDCPLRAGDAARGSSLFASPLAQGSFLSGLLDEALNATDASSQSAEAWNPFAQTLDVASRFTDLAVTKLASATPAQLAALAGVDQGYAELELKLLSALTSGDAITHHLEPAYFSALRRAANHTTSSRRRF